MVNRTELDLDNRVLGSPERNSGVSWPLAVDKRLDQLLEQARDEGERTTRKELVAAIVATLPVEETDIGGLLRQYRKALIRDVLIAADGGEVLTFVHNTSGPRRLDGSG